MAIIAVMREDAGEEERALPSSLPKTEVLNLWVRVGRETLTQMGQEKDGLDALGGGNGLKAGQKG